MIPRKNKCLKDMSLNKKNTYITKQFIKNNKKSWICHIERLSDFIYCGEGIWWKEDEYGI